LNETLHPTENNIQASYWEAVVLLLECFTFFPEAWAIQHIKITKLESKVVLKFYSAIRKNKAMWYEGKWMQLKDTM
jgi:hypothetical protein